MDIGNYEQEIRKAVSFFWASRKKQSNAGKNKDTGNRSSVTGGKQLDGFVHLIESIAKDVGIPESWIYTKNATLPGFFRPTKNWDLLIISDQGRLLAVCEFKSQVGSFGNNFNNRSEEAIGSAVDLWTAYRENGFGQQTPPWLGYLMLVEKSPKSTRYVKIKSPHFEALPEFEKASYLKRYEILCSKLTTERHYSAACLIAVTPNESFEEVSDVTSIQAFIRSLAGHLYSQL